MSPEILRELGLKIGHYTDNENLTGTTVFINENSMKVGIDVRGSNPASFNIASFQPKKAAQNVHAIVLTGGTTYGLESCLGVMHALKDKGIGYQTRAVLIPSVVGAVIYDVAVGEVVFPDKKAGESAVNAANYLKIEQGNIGVGTGATTGKWFGGQKLKGGFGMAHTKIFDDVIVSAFVVTNSMGDVADPATGKFYAENGNYKFIEKIIKTQGRDLIGLSDAGPTNTTLAVIATNYGFNREELMKVSELAHDGMARAIFPVHTMLDGDAVFALSTTGDDLKTIDKGRDAMPDIIGATAAEMLQEAIKNSVLYASSISNFPSYKEKYV